MPFAPTDFVALRAFVAVARARSFARAAEALGVSPSAVSQAVRGLEERLGDPLLRRTTRSMSLTPPGEALLRKMEPLLAGMAEGLEEARVAGPQIRGTVRIHASRLAAKLYLGPVLSRFAEKHPQVTIDLTLDDAVIDPVAKGYDAALRLGEVIEADMVAVPVGPAMRQCVVASPAYVAAHGLPERPADLLEHRCILWRWAGERAIYDWEFCENGRWFSVRPRGTVIVDDREFAMQVALDGGGLTMVSEPHAREHLTVGRLVPTLEAWSTDYPGFYLCYPQRRTVSRGLRALIDALASARADIAVPYLESS